MEWFKKHGDTIATLAFFAGCFWNLNEKMNENFVIVQRDISALQRDISAIDKEVAIIKTVMIMQNILPNELAIKEKE